MPTFAYQVSGEYAMIGRGAHGWLDRDAPSGNPLAFKRAGADAIFTYAALDVARGLKAG